jgi:predicted nucleic acid-binding protein
VILVDSNIPMYLVGAPHPHKADAQRLLEKLVGFTPSSDSFEAPSW